MKRSGKGRATGLLVPATAIVLVGLAWALVPNGAAADTNPFVPPEARQSEIEERVMRRIEGEVAAMEKRLMEAVEAAARQAAERATEKARAERPGEPPPSVLPPAMPGVGIPAVGLGADANPVPAGSVFIGCLDGKAFFQDRNGSPLLIDPRVFPPSAGGAAACAP